MNVLNKDNGGNKNDVFFMVHVICILTTISDSHIRSSVTQMRLSAHHLMIEKGRHLHLNVEDR
jgi:hypothetical protein